MQLFVNNKLRTCAALLSLLASVSFANARADAGRAEAPPKPDNAQHSGFAPQHFVPGETFSFTVVDLKGHVLPNHPVTIDGGPNGLITGTTDLHGVVVAKAPSTWKAARVLVGGVALTMLADKLSGGGNKPAITNAPPYVAGGSAFPINGKGFSGDAGQNTVNVGNQPARVLASSPTQLIVLAPANLPLGETTVTCANTQSPPNTEPVSVKTTVVSMRLESDNKTLHSGQSGNAKLIIDGTQDKVTLTVSALPGSPIQLTGPSGEVQTSGGVNNSLTIPFKALSPGQFDIRATLAEEGQTDYEKDLTKAEAARRDAADWRDSAAADSDENVAAAKRIAAGQSEKAAADWDAAAEARKHGDDKKGAAFEEAAKAREESSKAYGSDRDPGRGKAASDDAAAKEKAAKGE